MIDLSHWEIQNGPFPPIRGGSFPLSMTESEKDTSSVENGEHARLVACPDGAVPPCCVGSEIIHMTVKKQSVDRADMPSVVEVFQVSGNH